MKETGNSTEDGAESGARGAGKWGQCSLAALGSAHRPAELRRAIRILLKAFTGGRKWGRKGQVQLLTKKAAYSDLSRFLLPEQREAFVEQHQPDVSCDA